MKFQGCNSGSYTKLNKTQIKALWFKNKNENKTESINVNKKSHIKANMQSIEGYDLAQDSDLLEKVDIETMCLNFFGQVRIKLDTLFDSTIEIVDDYFICNGCGSIYWVCR